MRASWIVMLLIGALACAGLHLMMNHMKGVVSSGSLGFESFLVALKSEAVSPESLIIENHDGLRTLRISVDLRQGSDAKARARSIGELAWQSVGSLQSLDAVIVDWTGQGGGSLDVECETSVGRRHRLRAAANASRPSSGDRNERAPQSRPRTQPAPQR